MANSILDRIHSPEDLSFLRQEEIEPLCRELRDFLIENVSSTGGHLASNLGVVELTVALHRIFDSPRDHVIFDVGHQSYVHKILTGRRDEFPTLRSVGGLSGFTSRRESEHDPFGAGHSSTALSAALGFAEADVIRGSDAYTVCVMGDGAYTGGMVHEALNNSRKDLRLIIILNENRMSISKNRGNFSTYLSKVRVSKRYNAFKLRAKRFLARIPLLGKPLTEGIRAVRNFIKGNIYPTSYFEMLGIHYIGVINGHDEPALEKALSLAKSLEKTVIIHVKTKKGKGYEPAERSPDLFHSVYQASSTQTSFHSAFTDRLIHMAKSDGSVVAVTAAMGIGTGLSAFGETFPERYFDVGIAEEHALTFSAGLAAAGMKPYAVIYSTFLQRAYDNILHDVCLQELPVRIVIDRAGLSPHDGATHHGIFDVSFLSHIPNIKIFAPMTYASLDAILKDAATDPMPIAIRYPNGTESARILSAFYPEGDFENYGVRTYGDAESENIVVSYGAITEKVLDAVELLRAQGKDALVVLLECLKPYDALCESLGTLVRTKKRMLFVEEGIYNGGAGMIITNLLWQKGYLEGVHVDVYAIDDNFASPTAPCDLYDYLKLSAQKIAEYFSD